MMEIFIILRQKLLFLYSYLKSTIMGFLFRKRYRSIKTVCLFIGYPRSGHSLIASLLDAFPDVVMGMEWGVFPNIELGYKKNQVFYSLVRNSYLFRKRRKNIWTGYSYKVPGGWQGKVRKLLVIGDKHGGRTSLMLRKNPDLLSRFEKVTGYKPKLIHIMRNPFDMMTTHAIRWYEDNHLPQFPTDKDLLPQIQKFFYRADIIRKLKMENYYKILDIYHEEFVLDPRGQLSKILQFIDIQSDIQYIENCASIVFSTPNVSRKRINWPAELIEYVEKKLKEYPFLSRYRFSD